VNAGMVVRLWPLLGVPLIVPWPAFEAMVAVRVAIGRCLSAEQMCRSGTSVVAGFIRRKPLQFSRHLVQEMFLTGEQVGTETLTAAAENKWGNDLVRLLGSNADVPSAVYFTSSSAIASEPHHYNLQSHTILLHDIQNLDTHLSKNCNLLWPRRQLFNKRLPFKQPA
jgi:hypothetical protein